MENERTPLVSVIVPTRNRREKLNRCIESILASSWGNIEVVVVDDASDYDVAASFAGERRVKTIRNPKRMLLSFSRNSGARAAKGDLLFFLDDDNVVGVSAIEELVRLLDNDPNAAVSAPVIFRLSRPSEVWTSSIRKGIFPGFYTLGLQRPRGVIETFSFHDAFMVRRSVFEAVGRFDQVYFPMHFSELDLAYRIHDAGYSAKVSPAAWVWHDVAETHMNVDSTRAFYTVRNRILLLRRYGSAGDYLFYVTCMLPGVSVYYIIHHLESATDNRSLAARNLVRGIVAGLATPIEHATIAHPTTAVLREGSVLDHPGELPLVSVIIPAKNSAGTVAACIRSVLAQTYPRIEILLVDNFSTDGTPDVARGFPGVNVFEAGDERSAQVNVGAEMASGKYLYRVDSDFVLEPRLVEEAVTRCVLDGYKVVTIHNTSDPTQGVWARVRKLERDCYSDDDTHIAARFFDRDAFRAVGGFDEALIASEDYDLHNRFVAAGFAIGRINSKELHIDEPKSLKDVVRKHFFYGEKIPEFLSKTPRQLWTRELSPVRLAYLRHWRSFAKDPRLTARFFLYEYVRYCAAVAGYLSTIGQKPAP